MKAKHLMLAMTVLAIAGCSQNEITEKSPDANPAIGFSVYTGAQTRGTVADNTALQTSGFGILAYSTGSTAWTGTNEKPSFMYNQEVTYSGGWSYTPIKYWPKNTTDKISFFGYAPYDDSGASINKGIALSANSDTGNPTITFTVNDAANNMVDLMTDETQKDKTSASGTVAFKFKHILSRVNLVAKAAATLADGTSIVVKSAKISGSSSHTATKFYKTAVYTTNLSTGTGAWAAGTATFTSDYDLVSVLDKKDLGITGYSTQGIKIDKDNTTTEVKLFKDNEYLFLIPVTDFVKGDIEIKFEYDVVSPDASNPSSVVVSNETATVQLPASTLAKGTAYKYTFTISMNAIVVSGEVDPAWGAETEGSLDVKP